MDVMPNELKALDPSTAHLFSGAVKQYFGYGDFSYPQFGKSLAKEYEIFRTEIEYIIHYLKKLPFNWLEQGFENAGAYYRSNLKENFSWLQPSEIEIFVWGIFYDDK
jgi:hypothetical protein